MADVHNLEQVIGAQNLFFQTNSGPATEDQLWHDLVGSISARGGCASSGAVGEPQNQHVIAAGMVKGSLKAASTAMMA
jgi:hypothetical protein